MFHPLVITLPSQEHNQTKSNPRNWFNAFTLWLFLRVLLSAWAAFCSAIAPATELEKNVKLWPPASSVSTISQGVSFGTWLKRVFLAPWDRWDVEYYLKIAEQGYKLNDGTLHFQPLYPWVGRIAGLLLGGNMLLGLLVVSSVCGLLLLISFERLARLDLPPETARRAMIYFSHAPVAFIFFAPYTESLFLLCAVLSLLMARQGAWWRAGLAGGLAALTRQQGILLVVPLVWELWEMSSRSWSRLIHNWRNVAAIFLVPCGLLFWLIYRAFTLQDIHFNFGQPGSFIYGLLFSKNAAQVVMPGMQLMMPWDALAVALRSSDITTIIDLVLGSFFLLLLIVGGRFLWKLRPSYFLYALLIVLVSFSLSTGSVECYKGLARHCLLAFPLFLPLAAWGARRIIHLSVMAFGIACLFILLIFYVSTAYWLP
ncbi:MAG: hypothetical protein L0226_00210 [Acidobacteria bacterium]|nr:hypothetical protein [Acidobacteriota bacterium]